MKATKFIINGEEQQLSQALDVCIIRVSNDGQKVMGTIQQGNYVDGAIIVLIGSEPIDENGIEVTVGGVAHQLRVYPRDGQTGEYLMPTSATTGMLKISGQYDIFFRRQGGEWGIPQ